MRYTTKTVGLDLSLAKECVEMQQISISSCLGDVLHEAQQQGRLTCGIYDSGKLLAKRPENVMLCVLPEDSSDDVALHIHFTLLEAFCWENDIRIVKVDSGDKMKLLVNKLSCDGEKQHEMKAVTDCNCVLIEYPLDKLSPAEEKMIEFYKMSCDITPQPIIQLEV